MAQNQRTIATIYSTYLLDNTSGAISPQDVREGFETWRARHGQIVVPATSAATVQIADATNYVECNSTPNWDLTTGTQYEFNQSGGNGRLTYTGTQDVMAHVACTVSFGTPGGTGQLVHFRLGKNTGGGTTTSVDTEVQVKSGTPAGQIHSTALHWIVSLSTNDYLSLWIRNSSWAGAADDVDVECANLQLVTMPM